jgi:hypothetical protein
MAAIEEAAEEKFVVRLAAHLLQKYSQSVVTQPDMKSTVAELPEENLHSLVRISIAHARSYDLRKESAISAFSALMFEVAPNFDKHQLSRLILNDETVEPEARLDQLLEALNENNWTAIRKTYDPEAWRPKPEAEEPAETKSEEEK